MARPLYFDRRSVADLGALVASYGRGELSSPFRSTVPLLALLRGEGSALSEVLNCIGVGRDAALHFEYRIGVVKGKGLPSQTDLMVKSAAGSCAIEAKWTEPRYETVSEWIDGGRHRNNRLAVLNGWLDLIEPHCNRRIKADDVMSCVYQMIHRAASACAASSPGMKPAMVYLKFHTGANVERNCNFDYKSDLQTLHSALGNPSSLLFYLTEIELLPTDDFVALEHLKKGEDSTEERIRYELCAKHLFDLSSIKVEQIPPH